jgi:putative nucleotidyltransferase with HDIG domain
LESGDGFSLFIGLIFYYSSVCIFWETCLPWHHREYYNPKLIKYSAIVKIIFLIFKLRCCAVATSDEQTVKRFQEVEEELRYRNAGWWGRIVKTIPELAALSNTLQSNQYHSEGDVAVHTRLAVEACTNDCESDLLWAALLHDVGKPLMTRVDGDNIRSHGHETAGAEIAEKILQRLQMPSKRLDKIVWAVRHHTFHFSWNLTSPEDASRRQRRFVVDPRFPLLVELLRVDAAASSGSSRKMKAYELYKQLRKIVRKS